MVTIVIQFVMFIEFYDNENQLVIHRCLIILEYYSRMLLFAFGLLVCRNPLISGASGNAGVPHDYKRSCQYCQKKQNEMSEKNVSRLDFHK